MPGWSKDATELPNNYIAAYSQLLTLERRLAKQPALKTRYVETIQKNTFELWKKTNSIQPTVPINGTFHIMLSCILTSRTKSEECVMQLQSTWVLPSTTH